MSPERQKRLRGKTSTVEFNLLCHRKKLNSVIVFEAIATSKLRGLKLLAKVLHLERQLTLLTKLGHNVEVAGIVSPAAANWSEYTKKHKIQEVCPSDAIPQISELVKHDRFYFLAW